MNSDWYSRYVIVKFDGSTTIKFGECYVCKSVKFDGVGEEKGEVQWVK